MFNHHDIARDACMLHGPLAHHGYDWWWHSFTAQDAETGEDKPFFIEFFLCNPALGEEEPVLGQLPENRAAGKRPSYLMVKAGTWGRDACQLHRFFGWKQVELHGDAPYRIQAADCLASETELKGSVSISPQEAAAHPEWMCGAGQMSWELTLDKQIAFNVGYGASKPLRDAEAFAMYWHAEGMKSGYGGNVTFNGRRYTVSPERSFGYADKNWGRDFTSPWVWLSSNCLTSKKTGQPLRNSVFDIGGGRPKVYFVPLRNRKAFFRAVTEFPVFAFSGFVDDLAAYYFTRNTRNGQSACHFRTDRNYFMTFAKCGNLFTEIVAAVVFAFLSQQTCAYHYLHRFESSFDLL